MTYRFGNFEVKDISITDFENMLDIVIDLYLGILGTKENEIKEAFEDVGFEVVKVEE